MVVDDIDKGCKSSDDLENVYGRIANMETTGSDNNVGDDRAVYNQEGAVTLGFIK